MHHVFVYCQMAQIPITDLPVISQSKPFFGHFTFLSDGFILSKGLFTCENSKW